MKNYFEGKKKIIIYSLFIILGVFLTTAVFFAIQYSQIQKENKIREEVKNDYLTKSKIQEAKIQAKKEIFDNLETNAGAVLAIDMETGKEIFSENKDKRFGIASLTKIATSDVYLESEKDVETSNVTVLKKNLAKLEDNGLKWGERFDGRELVKFMMAVSSNDAASVLANDIGESLFIKKMNTLAEALDINSTLFFSESGLDINTNILGSYSTASDMAELVSYFYKKYPELSGEFSTAAFQVCSEKFCHNVENTNVLLSEKTTCILFNPENTDECLETKTEKYPHKILFSKTGYTEKSRGSLSMIVEISGKEILMVVLGSGKEERFEDIKELSGAVESYLKIK